MFPFGALFALASVGFIALEVGYLPAFNAMLPEGSRIGDEGRAVVEGLMLTSLILCLVSFVDLRKRWPVAGNVLLLVGALSLAIPLYGWFEPAPALAIARIGFALAAVGGFAVIIALLRERVVRAQASLLTWSLIVLWTFAAAFAVLTPARGNSVVAVADRRAGFGSVDDGFHACPVCIQSRFYRATVVRGIGAPRAGPGGLAAICVGLAG